MKEQGNEVIGISMKTHEENGDGRAKTCCAARDIQDARRICQQLDIPFYPLNLKEEFSQGVIGEFAAEYSRGRTPNPCVLCNDRLKFTALLSKAKQLGAYYLATGHYVQKIRDGNGRYHLHKARDLEKDQSYFLFGLSQAQLEHLLFPIGRCTKAEVRELARTAGLETAEKPESQEICFVSSGHYSDIVESRYPALKGRRGVIVNREGQVLGEHDGIHAFTVGQRRGLKVSGADRLYVTQLIPEQNKVVLGSKEDLMRKGVLVKGTRWINPDLVTSGLEVETKIRYRHPPIRSTLSVLDEGTLRVGFERPDGAIAPGQAAVFYRGEELLGGGWIEEGIDA